MSHKRNEALRHVQHSMHHVIAAGEGSDRAPDSCKLCPYYRPDFKFRTCLYLLPGPAWNRQWRKAKLPSAPL